MALDEPKDTDETFDVKGHKFVVEKEFMAQAQNIKVDFTGMGFRLDSNLDLGGDAGCSGCGGSDSCG